MTPSCSGYWVNINTSDPVMPAQYKCMTQAEYDQWHAQTYQAKHGQDGLMLVILGIFVFFVVGSISILVWQENRQSK